MPCDARIALLIDTATSWGAGLIEGVARFAQTQADWLLHFEARGKYEPFRLPKGWQGDGVVARVHSAELADHLVATGLPAVNVSWFRHGGARIAHCTTDVRAAGRQCAEHLLDQGFRHFAYCGSPLRGNWHDQFGESFAARLSEAQFPCAALHQRRLAEAADQWVAEMGELSQWLTELPKPVGLLAMDALRGREVLEACCRAGLQVPDEIAVLAGDYDSLCCELSRPPMSSLDISAQRVGFEAAALLARMIEGKPIANEWVSVAPGRITTRQSTDTLAIDDIELARAIRVVRRRACERIHVKDILAEVAFSRRGLEQRFRDVLGRSPAAEIRRVRVEQAKRLLEDTHLPMMKVAQRCGFEHSEVLTRNFRRETGTTPSAYRKRIRKPEGLQPPEKAPPTLPAYGP